MKKGWLLIGAVFLSILAACSSMEQYMPQNRVTFYYCASGETAHDRETGALGVEICDLGELSCTPQTVLQRYFGGPKTPGLSAAVPQDITVREATLKDGQLCITLSENWDQVVGMEHRLAEACLVLTMTQLPEVKTVCLQPDGESSHAFCRPMTAADFVLYDDFATSDQVTVKLYYGDSEGRFLIEENRSGDQISDSDMPAYILQQLLDGPGEDTAQAVIPEGTKLRQVKVEQGLCTVEFSQAFYLNRPATHQQARLAVFSVVNSLTELPQIERVQIVCGTLSLGDYAGLDLSQPLLREELTLKPAAASGSVVDTVFYIPCGTGGKLAPVPVCVRQSAGRRRIDAVLDGLLSFKSGNGYENPFSPGTAVVAQTLTDGVCRVTFNRAFAPDGTDSIEAQMAVRAVVATVCQLDEIERVQVMIEGEDPGTAENEPMLPAKNWLIP